MGGSGGDEFHTSAGNDTLNGGAGTDWIEVTSGSSIADDTLISVEAARFNSTADKLTLTTTQLAAFSSFQSSGSNAVTYHFALAGGPAATVGGVFDSSRAIEIDGSVGNDTLSFAPSVFNTIYFDGGAGNDKFTGGSGGDYLNGGVGADTLTGVRGENVFYGTLSELNGDTITDFDTFDTLRLEGAPSASTKISYVAATNSLRIDLDGNGSIDAVVKLLGTFQGTFVAGAGPRSSMTDITFVPNASTAGADSHIGTNGEDSLAGLGGNDTLDGSLGADTLNGGAGSDWLIGGSDADRLIGTEGADTLVGGTGADIFDYNAVSDSAPSGRDRIDGFDGAGAAAGDRIDLADVYGGVLSFIGDAVFTTVGQVRVVTEGANTVVEVNTGGTLVPDMAIVIVDGATLASSYSAADFIL